MRREFFLAERMRTGQNGSMLVYALVIATVAGIFIAAASRLLIHTSSQFTKAANTVDLLALTEKGLNDAIGQLARNPEVAEFDTSTKTNPEDSRETYQNTVQKRNKPEPGTFYIVTSANKTVGGKTYRGRLHTYARIVEISAYFAAVSDTLTISHPADISLGKIYAPRLVFQWNDGFPTPTKVGSATFFESCDPPLLGDGSWPNNVMNDVKILNTPKSAPVQLSTPLVLPQVSEVEMAQYALLAGPHTVRQTFQGEIYPPGYSNFVSNTIGDEYALPNGTSLHTTDNTHHIYFFDGDIFVKGRVHGQVLFVATGDIHITSNLVSADVMDPLPGVGVNASTAHQAVFITRKNVIIDNTFYNGVAGGLQTQSIQGLFFAPNSALIPTSYGNDAIHSNLALNFKGALIMATLKSTPGLPTVFKAGRTYSYMDSLKVHIPPYLPAFSEILYSLYEVVD